MKVLFLAAFFALASAAQPMMVGGYTDQNASDPEFLELLWKPTVTTAVNEKNPSNDFAYVPVKVLSVRTQVVAGLNYDMQVQFGQSSCKKDTTDLKAANCAASANGPTKTYHVVIFSQPWTKTLEVTKIEEVQGSR